METKHKTPPNNAMEKKHKILVWYMNYNEHRNEI